MKAFLPYMDHIDHYCYMENSERLEILSGPGSEEAGDFHQAILRDFALEENARWELEIAIDVLRRLSPGDRQYMSVHLDESLYHFGLGMWIRNTYIHPASQHSYFMADSVSSQVLRCIFSILHPVYDFRNEDLCSFYSLSELSSFPASFEEIRLQVREETACALLAGSVSGSEAYSLYRENLKEALGTEGFSLMLQEALTDAAKAKDFQGFQEISDLRSVLWGMTELYPLEVNQIIALNSLGFLDQIDELRIGSREECGHEMDRFLGLKPVCRDFLSGPLFLACHPARTGRLSEKSIFAFRLSHAADQMLKDRGLNTVGKVKLRMSRISDLPREDQDKILSCLKTWDAVKRM